MSDKKLLNKLICRFIGHDVTNLLKGVYSGGDVTFTDEKITFRCERCDLTREPTEGERNEAMKELLHRKTGIDVR